MSHNVVGWWTDERVDKTVTSPFVLSHLRPNEAEQLTNSVFGGLSDDTYLEWILTRSKRFFLILVEAGVPDQIFGVIDDSFDDEDLPIPEDAVADLRLSFTPNKSLDRHFYKAQFKYLTRVVGDGEHIRYADEESVPVHQTGARSPVAGRDQLDKVRLPSSASRVFLRRRFGLQGRLPEDVFLAEIAAVKQFAHEHVVSVFGSYTHDGSLYVLLTPSSDLTLKSFLNDLPKAFEALSKPERHHIFLRWLSCLANALAWLHAHQRHHGAIRPSRVQVCDNFKLSLGFFDNDWILGMPSTKDDIEAYQYAAPERWKRAVTVQSTGSNKVAFPSGGRSVRRVGQDGSAMYNHGDDSSSSRERPLDLSRPTSTSYAFVPTSKSNFSRLKLSVADRLSNFPTTPRRESASRQSNRSTESQGTIRNATNHGRHPGASRSMSSSSSGSIGRDRDGMPKPIFAAAPDMRTAVVQTWASAAHDLLAADMFGLGATFMEILTVFCKRSSGAFAKHRAAKNRQAGRGGGLADASFHANLGQVAAWAQTLLKDAEKRAKREDGSAFRAVGPMLQLVMQCLDREPSQRTSANTLARKVAEYLSDFAGLKSLHCEVRDPEEVQQPFEDEELESTGPSSRRTSSSMKVNLGEHPRHARKPSSRNGGPPSHAVLGNRKPTGPSEPMPLSSPMGTFNMATEYMSDTLVMDDINEDQETFFDEGSVASPGVTGPTKDPMTTSEDTRRPRSERQRGPVARDVEGKDDPVRSYHASSSSTPRTYDPANSHLSTSASSVTSDDQTPFSAHSPLSTYTPPTTQPPNRGLPTAPFTAQKGKQRSRADSGPTPSADTGAVSGGSRYRRPHDSVQEATYELGRVLDSTSVSEGAEYAASRPGPNYSLPGPYARRGGRVMVDNSRSTR